jgi:hypothetical protein
MQHTLLFDAAAVLHPPDSTETPMLPLCALPWLLHPDQTFPLLLLVLLFLQ